MSLTVIAHFNKGMFSPFPATIKNIGGEGEVFKNPRDLENGGVIVTNYDTDNLEMLVTAFKKHLAESELTLLCVHRVNDSTVCYSETTDMIF